MQNKNLFTRVLFARGGAPVPSISRKAAKTAAKSNNMDYRKGYNNAVVSLRNQGYRGRDMRNQARWMASGINRNVPRVELSGPATVLNSGEHIGRPTNSDIAYASAFNGVNNWNDWMDRYTSEAVRDAERRNMTFKQAFRNAINNGDLEFNWGGKRYNTRMRYDPTAWEQAALDGSSDVVSGVAKGIVGEEEPPFMVKYNPGYPEEVYEDSYSPNAVAGAGRRTLNVPGMFEGPDLSGYEEEVPEEYIEEEPLPTASTEPTAPTIPVADSSGVSVSDSLLRMPYRDTTLRIPFIDTLRAPINRFGR